jgi:hypothetical protein
MHPVKREQTPADHFRTDINGALSWHELEVVCAHIDNACLRGTVELHTVEALCKMVSHRACQLPQYTTLAIGALLTSAEDCDCCGSVAWRDNGDQVVCAICHPAPLPRPLVGIQRRQAA